MHNNRSTEKLVLIEESPVSELESSLEDVAVPVTRSGMGATLVLEDNFDGSYKVTAEYPDNTQEILSESKSVYIPESSYYYTRTLTFFEDENKTILLSGNPSGNHDLWTYDWGNAVLQQMRVGNYIHIVREPALSSDHRYMLSDYNNSSLYILDLLQDIAIEVPINLGKNETLHRGGVYEESGHHAWLNDNIVEYSVYDETKVLPPSGEELSLKETREINVKDLLLEPDKNNY